MRVCERIAALAACISVSLAASAAAEPFSAYSSLDPAHCSVTEEDTESASVLLRCPDFRGHRVEILEGDLRFHLLIDDEARTKLLSGQTPVPFNRLGTTLEWRMDETAAPFAVIVRYHTEQDRGDGSFEKGELLVVSKIGETACHVAMVDARANANANALARLAADEHARGFDCAADSLIRIGKRRD